MDVKPFINGSPCGCLYLLNDVVEGSLEFVVSGAQLPEISVSLQDRHNDLVHLIHCLIKTTLKTTATTLTHNIQYMARKFVDT